MKKKLTFTIVQMKIAKNIIFFIFLILLFFLLFRVGHWSVFHGCGFGDPWSDVLFWSNFTRFWQRWNLHSKRVEKIEKLHSKRVERLRNYTRNGWKRLENYTLNEWFFQLAFLLGLIFLLGPFKTFRFFFRKEKTIGSICFGSGLVGIVVGWTFVGFILEMYGVWKLFAWV